MIYDNGVKVWANKMDILETISSEPIVNSFFTVFSEKYLRKQIKKGLTRNDVLKKMPDSNRHKVMKGESHIINYFPILVEIFVFEL